MAETGGESLRLRFEGKVYDARPVGVSIVYGLKAIVTFNVEDFRRFGEIEVIHPRDAIIRS